ncbi:MAG: dTDP-4-dehydrorhamnose reductase [Phycisphaerales bacterium]
MSPPPPIQTPIRRVLVIGAGGMLGRAWRGVLAAHAIEHDAVDLPAFDLLDADAVRRAVPGHTHVVNCSGWTDVDGAEPDEKGATRLNGHAIGPLTAACREAGAHLVHYSTDYVFAGDATEPYPTDAPRAPISAYGRSKAVGEELLEASDTTWTLVRTSWLYAPWGKNFVRTIAKLAAERESVRVVADQRGRPTSAEHLARASLALLAGGRTGTWHITDAGECTWCDFAREIARLTASACAVEPCTTDEFPRPARRPAFSVLDIDSTQRAIGPFGDWRTNLADVVRRLPIHENK